MDDAKKLFLRLKAEQVRENLYSKKCARKNCENCPARIAIGIGRMVFKDGLYGIDPEYVCVRDVLKQFIKNLKV